MLNKNLVLNIFFQKNATLTLLKYFVSGNTLASKDLLSRGPNSLGHVTAKSAAWWGYQVYFLQNVFKMIQKTQFWLN